MQTWYKNRGYKNRSRELPKVACADPVEVNVKRMPNSKCGYLAFVPSRSGIPFPSDATRLRLERPRVAEGREMRAVDKRDKSPRGKLILVTFSRTLSCRAGLAVKETRRETSVWDRDT